MKLFYYTFLFFSLIFFSNCKNENSNKASKESSILGRVFFGIKPIDYGKFLNSVSANYILPAYQDLSTNGDSLYKSSISYQANPNIANLTTLRTNWQNLKSSIKRVEVLGIGPAILPLNYFINIDLYPSFTIDTSKIEIEEINSATVLNLSRIQSFGVTKRCIQSIEYILYDNGLSNSDINLNHAALIGNIRRIQYLVALTEDMQIRTRNFNNEWQNNFNSEFVSGTKTFTSQKNVLDELVNQIGFLLGTFIDSKIGDPAGLSVKSRGIQDLTKLESRYSNRSIEDIENNFEGIKAIYNGTLKGSVNVSGITDLVKSINPNLDTKIKTQFSLIDSQINLIKQESVSLKSAIQNKFSSVQTLHTQFRNLRTIFLTELLSSLGTSLQVGSSDGD